MDHGHSSFHGPNSDITQNFHSALGCSPLEVLYGQKPWHRRSATYWHNPSRSAKVAAIAYEEICWWCPMFWAAVPPFATIHSDVGRATNILLPLWAIPGSRSSEWVASHTGYIYLHLAKFIPFSMSSSWRKHFGHLNVQVLTYMCCLLMPLTAVSRLRVLDERLIYQAR